jgi:hypothetical protein
LAEADAVEATEIRPVVDETPRQDAIEVGAEGELADARADQVVAQRLLRAAAVEAEGAEVSVGIEAAQVLGELLHEQVLASAPIATGVELARLDDRVRVPVVGVRARENLLHLEGRPLASRDDRLHPVVERQVSKTTPRNLPSGDREWLDSLRASA